MSIHPSSRSFCPVHTHTHTRQLVAMGKATQSRAKQPQPRAKQSKPSKQPQSRAKKRSKQPSKRSKAPQSARSYWKKRLGEIRKVMAEAPQSQPRCDRTRGRGLSEFMLNHIKRGHPECVLQDVTKTCGKDPGGLGEACNPYSKGWKKCIDFLSKGCTETCDKSRNSVQLLQINGCSALMQGVQADVNWFIGGSAYVELPAAVAAVRPGVYLAMTTWFPMVPRSEMGPETPVANISRLRWIGTAQEIFEMVRASRHTLGKKRYDRLVEMLTFNVDSPSELECSPCEPQSRALSAIRSRGL